MGERLDTLESRCRETLVPFPGPEAWARAPQEGLAPEVRTLCDATEAWVAARGLARGMRRDCGLSEATARLVRPVAEALAAGATAAEARAAAGY